MLELLHGGHSTLEPIAAVMGHASGILGAHVVAFPTASREGLFLGEVGSGARRCTQLVLHDSLVADIIIAAEGNVLIHSRLIQIKAASEVLKPSLRTQ